MDKNIMTQNGQRRLFLTGANSGEYGLLSQAAFCSNTPKISHNNRVQGNVMSQDGLTLMATRGDQNRFKHDADILLLLLLSGERVRYGISSRSSRLLLEDGETSPVPLTKPQSKSAAAHVADLRGAASSL